jgi:hypothetical protein
MVIQRTPLRLQRSYRIYRIVSNRMGYLGPCRNGERPDMALSLVGRQRLHDFPDRR